MKKTRTNTKGTIAHCSNCGSVQPVTIFVAVCDKDPKGIGVKGHGNVIDNTITCSTEYCNPTQITLAEFHRINGKDAKPSYTDTRCATCGSLLEEVKIN